MKTLTLNAEKTEAFKRTNKLVLTASMLICLTVGWCLGSFTSKASSHSVFKNTSDETKNNVILPSVAIKGKSLPTIILNEFSITAYKRK